MRTLQTELVEKGISEEGNMRTSKRRHPKKKMSQREIEELMGVRCST